MLSQRVNARNRTLRKRLQVSLMLLNRVRSLLEDLLREFHDQDFRSLLSHYDFPVSLTIEGREVQMNRPREFEALLREHAASHVLDDLRNTLFTVSAVEIPRRGRFRAWVRYHHCDSSGAVARTSDRIFSLRDRSEHLMIEEVHLTHMPFEGLRAWQPALRCTA